MKLTFVSATTEERNALALCLMADGWLLTLIDGDDYTIAPPERAAPPVIVDDTNDPWQE